jgi:plasmid stabilization system protein ParE
MKVHWSNAAKQGYAETIEYLEDNWGNESVNELRKKVLSAVKSILKMPYIGVYSNEYKARKLVVAKYNIIVYLHTNEEIYIVAFIDARSNHPY